MHISLLVIVLVGLAAPPGLGAGLRGPLKTKYTVALQRHMVAAGELATYTEIRRQFIAGRTATPPVATLTAIVIKIHDIGTPAPGDSSATGTEDHLAHRLGLLQATTLRLGSRPSVTPAGADLAGFDSPAGDTQELRDRLGMVDAAQRQSDAVTKNVDQAAESAAVAATLQIPHLGANEVVQIVREYLSGLVEGSPLKEVFAAWAVRLSGAASRRAPPAWSCPILRIWSRQRPPRLPRRASRRGRRTPSAPIPPRRTVQPPPRRSTWPTGPAY